MSFILLVGASTCLFQNLHGSFEALESGVFVLLADDLMISVEFLLILVGKDREITALPHNVVDARTSASRYLL
jgi:hypothetical protein